MRHYNKPARLVSRPEIPGDAMGLACVLACALVAASCSSGAGRGGSGTGGASVTGGSSAKGGSSSTGGTSAGGGASGNKGSGGSSGTSTTSADGSKPLGSLTSSESDQLCKETYATYAKAISQATLCKLTGLTYTISSSAPTDAVMQENCKTTQATCLKADPYVAGCNALPTDCKVTVDQYRTCIADEAAAYNKAVAAMAECPVVASKDKPAIWDFVIGDLPQSCMSLTSQCASLDIPLPKPGNTNSGAGGSGGAGGASSGSGGVSSGGNSGRGGSGGSTVASGGVSGTGGNTNSSELPGDVAKAAGTPFVAAHSMTRALFAAYKGSLFKAVRTSDSQEKDIGLTTAGLVDAATLKSFCSGTSCKVATLYDQSGNGNDMWRGDIDTNRPSDNPSQLAKICDMLDIDYWQMSDGTQVPIAIEHGWETAGGMWKDRGQCLRNRDKTKNMPTGSNPQSTYAVFHSKYVNGGCCFNYGNTGKAIHYTGPGTLSALTFSKMTFWSKGLQNGPWPMVDWEQGVYAGNTAKCGSGAAPTADCTTTGENPNPPVAFDVVTVVFKHDGTKHWALKSANAKSGALSVNIDLPSLPKGYSPLKQEGGLGLGEGGAGDSGGSGGFSEGGVMAGETNDTTDNAIQKSIVGVYGK